MPRAEQLARPSGLAPTFDARRHLPPDALESKKMTVTVDLDVQP
jgi:hypothetical protein